MRNALAITIDKKGEAVSRKTIRKNPADSTKREREMKFIPFTFIHKRLIRKIPME